MAQPLRPPALFYGDKERGVNPNLPINPEESSSTSDGASNTDAAPSRPPPPPSSAFPTPPPPVAVPIVTSEGIDSDVSFDAPSDANAMRTERKPTDVTVHAVMIDSGVRRAGLPAGLLSRVAVIGLVVALLAAGLSAVSNLGSSDGADTPEQAVQELLESVARGDLLGAAELIEPAERATLIDPGITMVAELQRLRVLSDDFQLGNVGAISYELSDMSYVATGLSEQVAVVEVRGTIATSGDSSTLPLGDLLLDNLGQAELDMMQQEASTESIDGESIVAVARDGRWYISYWYTVAEAMREQVGAPLPDFGAGPVPDGGDSPEDLVEKFVERATSFDIGGMIASLDPDEAAALYDYSTLFLEDAQAALDEATAGSRGVSVDVTRVDVRSDVDGDNAQVWVEGIAATITADEGSAVIDTSAACMVLVDEGSGEYCAVDEGLLEEQGAEWGVALDIGDFLPPSIRMHRVDGKWYLSPGSSLMLPMLDFVSTVEPDQLERWVANPDVALTEAPPMIDTSLLIVGGLIVGVAFFYAFSTLGEALSDFEGDFAASSGVVSGEDPFESELITVFFVDAAIPAGTPVSEALLDIEATQWPIDWVSADHVTDLNTVRGMVTAVDLWEGEVLTRDAFVSEGSASGTATTVEDSKDSDPSDVDLRDPKTGDPKTGDTQPGGIDLGGIDFGDASSSENEDDSVPTVSPTTTQFVLGPIG